MAAELVTEVILWSPVSLTHRERLVLIILAENAHARTRQIWDSVESPLMLRKTQVSRPQMYVVLRALVDKGCLTVPVAGGHNHRAKYAIAHLRPGPASAQCLGFADTENHAQCPDLGDTEAPHKQPGHSAQCPQNRDPDSLTGTGRMTGSAEGAKGTARPAGLTTSVTGSVTDRRRSRPAPRQPGKTGQVTTARTDRPSQ